MKKLLLLITIASAACGGSDSGPDQSLPPGDEDFTPPPTDDGSGAVPPNATVACSAEGVCDYWFCACEDGAIVNAYNCTNGYCLDAAASCPDACATFDHGAWTGNFGGGPRDPVTPPVNECGRQGSSSPTCQRCAEASCCDELRTCDDNPDCLSYWDCITACNPGDTFCQDDCSSGYPDGEYDFGRLSRCLNGSCRSECSS